ncbi:hypothetical protein GCM10009562_35560 [Nocardioides aquaticus]
MQDHVKLAAWVVNKIRVTGAHVVNIDATGLGHGLVNLLTAYGKKGHHRSGMRGQLRCPRPEPQAVPTDESAAWGT